MTICVVCLSLLVGVLRWDTTEFPEALARRGCSQEDAPALEVYLTRVPFDGRGDPAKPYIRLEIAGREFRTLVDQPVELSPLSRAGRDPHKPLARAEFAGEGSVHRWLRGTVKLRRVEPEDLVEGTYELSRDGDEKWSGTFKARWVASAGGCG